MNSYSLAHLSNGALMRDLATLVDRDRSATAQLLAHIAEVDARKLYVPAAYPSMLFYCVHELHMSEDAARKRIHAARAARDFPAIFSAVAEGRLHLSGVVMLAPRLTSDNAEELLAAAVHKTRPEIELLLAERFPRPDVPTQILPIPVASAASSPGEPLGPIVEQRAPGRVATPAPLPKLTPRSSHRYALTVTIEETTHAKLCHVQALLGHRIPSGDLVKVLDHVLDLAIRHLEKRKFAATIRPRPGQHRSTREGRYIPAHIRRAVWKRDGGRCTYVSESGTRCPSRNVEFDHVDPVARGGQASVDRVRLLCRPHNQLAAERTLGADFMEQKREASRNRAAQKRAAKESARADAAARAATEEHAQAEARAAAEDRAAKAREVVPWLRQLGFRAEEARRAAALTENVPDAPLEERVRIALSSLAPSRRVSRATYAQNSP